MRLGICQFDIKLGEIESNFSKILHFIKSAKHQKVDILAFPESSFAGYCFESEDEVSRYAMSDDHPILLKLQEAAHAAQILIVIGYIEKSDQRLYNTAAIFGLGPGIKKYRKNHLLVLGLDRFVEKGNLGFPVFDTPYGKLGLNICYDQRFPESARSTMLNGAQIILTLTNFPQPALAVHTLLTTARAFENRVFYAFVNRVGEEKSSSFFGRSTVVNPYGEVIACLDDTEESIAVADLNLAEADTKKTIFVKNEYEIDLLGDRRTDLYTF